MGLPVDCDATATCHISHTVWPARRLSGPHFQMLTFIQNIFADFFAKGTKVCVITVSLIPFHTHTQSLLTQIWKVLQVLQVIALLQVSWRPAVRHREGKTGTPARPREGQAASAAAHTSGTNALAGGQGTSLQAPTLRLAFDQSKMPQKTWREVEMGIAALVGTGDPNP